MASDSRSEGCNDGDKKPNTPGKAYIYVDDMHQSLYKRRHDVIVLDASVSLFASVVYLFYL